jgi:hypothetical protein
MGLPKLDIPINLLTWEVSLPDRMEVKQFGGNALAAELLPVATQDFIAANAENVDDVEATAPIQNEVELSNLQPGQIGGIVTDSTGAVIPNANVTVVNKQTGTTLSTRADAEGRWMVSSALPGPTTVRVESPGFKIVQNELNLVAMQPGLIGTTLEPGVVSEVVTVTALNGMSIDGVKRAEEMARQSRAQQLSTPSANVTKWQGRVAGILPVRIDIPKSGRSYRFVRTLVMDEETTIALNYKLR